MLKQQNTITFSVFPHELADIVVAHTVWCSINILWRNMLYLLHVPGHNWNNPKLDYSRRCLMWIRFKINTSLIPISRIKRPLPAFTIINQARVSEHLHPQKKTLNIDLIYSVYNILKSRRAPRITSINCIFYWNDPKRFYIYFWCCISSRLLIPSSLSAQQHQKPQQKIKAFLYTIYI